MKHLLKVEPVAITALVTAILGLLVLVGVIDESLSVAIFGVIAAALIIVRQMVTPVAEEEVTA